MKIEGLNNTEKEGNKLEELRELIKEQPTRLEAEFTRTDGSWLESFVTSILIIQTTIQNPEVKILLSSEKYQEALDQLKKLNQSVTELRKLYPDHKTSPPDDTKEELLGQLDVLDKKD